MVITLALGARCKKTGVFYDPAPLRFLPPFAALRGLLVGFDRGLPDE